MYRTHRTQSWYACLQLVFVILEIRLISHGSVGLFRMFEKLFSAIILGVCNFRVFEIYEHLSYNISIAL